MANILLIGYAILSVMALEHISYADGKIITVEPNRSGVTTACFGDTLFLSCDNSSKVVAADVASSYWSQTRNDNICTFNESDCKHDSWWHHRPIKKLINNCFLSSSSCFLKAEEQTERKCGEVIPRAHPDYISIRDFMCIPESQIYRRSIDDSPLNTDLTNDGYIFDSKYPDQVTDSFDGFDTTWAFSEPRNITLKAHFIGFSNLDQLKVYAGSTTSLEFEVITLSQHWKTYSEFNFIAKEFRIKLSNDIVGSSRGFFGQYTALPLDDSMPSTFPPTTAPPEDTSDPFPLTNHTSADIPTTTELHRIPPSPTTSASISPSVNQALVVFTILTLLVNGAIKGLVHKPLW